jgi:integrative and conjugative element protein (TIGR02256 family)
MVNSLLVCSELPVNSSVVEFWSSDRAFGLHIEPHIVHTVFRHCHAAFPNETGGILIGRYSARHDCAVVQEASEPPKDSRASPTSFYRGVDGLQQRLDVAWKKYGNYYLGEWHSHPLARPVPSGADDVQLTEIAVSSNYRCPEPLLLLIGREMSRIVDCRAYVYPLNEQRQELSSISSKGAPSEDT